MKIPTSWDQISLGQFIEINDLLKLSFEHEYERELHLISIATRQEYRKLNSDMKLAEITAAAKKLQFLKDVEAISKVAPRKFKIGSRKYKVNLNIASFTAGMFIDLDTYLKDGLNSLHYIMATICTPANKNFFGKSVPETMEERNQRAKLFYQYLPITVAYPVSLFFSTLLMNSLLVIESSLAKKIREGNRELLEMLKESLNERRTDGTGTEFSTESREEMLLSGMKLPN